MLLGLLFPSLVLLGLPSLVLLGLVLLGLVLPGLVLPSLVLPSLVLPSLVLPSLVLLGLLFQPVLGSRDHLLHGLGGLLRVLLHNRRHLGLERAPVLLRVA